MTKITSTLFRRFLITITVFTVTTTVESQDSRSHRDIVGQAELKAKAEELKQTIVTPHLEQKIADRMNVLWCSTFQLTWNELIDLTGGPIRMVPPSPTATVLNKKTATKRDLDRDSYLAMAGLANKRTYDRIRKELQRKFQGRANPELLNPELRNGWVAYAYLFKELPFRWAFTRFHSNLAFEGYLVDSFGISQLSKDEKDEVKMARQVAILDHKSNDDFIVELITLAEQDRLILAKIPPEETLGETISVVKTRISKAKRSRMEEDENLFVPVLDFDILKEYSELYGRTIRKNNKTIVKPGITAARQIIRFRLDERGAVLRSEAIGHSYGRSFNNLRFDKPFLILLERRRARHPYFALWVGNAELLVPSQKKPIEPPMALDLDDPDVI